MSPALPGDPVPEYGISGIMFWEGAWNHSKESFWAGVSWRGTIFHTAQWNLVECSSKSYIIMGQCIHVSQGLVFEKLVQGKKQGGEEKRGRGLRDRAQQNHIYCGHALQTSLQDKEPRVV